MPATCPWTTHPWTASSSTLPTRKTSATPSCPISSTSGSSAPPATVFPDDFTDYLTEKDQEAISSPARFRSQAVKGNSAKTLALADYQEKMAEIFAECRRVIKDDGIATVMFNHKSTAALGCPHRRPDQR